MFFMDLSNKIFYPVFFVILLIGMIFTDLPIANKTVTHSLMIFIAPLLFIIILIINNFKLNFFESKISKIFFLYCIFSFVSSIFIFIILIILRKGNIYFYNTNLLVKFFESYISLTLLHFCVYYLTFYFIMKLDIIIISKIFYMVVIFLILFAFVEYFKPELTFFIHSDKYFYNRLRLTNSESSHAILNFSIFALLFLSTYFNKKITYLNKFFLVLIFLFIFFNIKSKGGIISLVTAVLLLIILNFSKVRVMLICSVLLIPIFLIIFKLILPSIIIDINNFTSFSTRFTGLMSMFYILLFYPFGTGYGSYIYFYPKVLMKTFEKINIFFQKTFSVELNSSEIISIISTGTNIGAKATIPQMVMLNGWIGLIFILLVFFFTFHYIKKLDHKVINKNILYLLVIFLFIQLLIGSEYTLLYSIWLPIAFIESMFIKNK